MTIVTESIQIRSRGENDMIDITGSISKAVEDSKIEYGIVTVFIAGSTATCNNNNKVVFRNGK